jgi:hypothetical protein
LSAERLHRQGVSADKLASFSQEPLKEPLLASIEQSKHKKEAAKIFLEVMKFMGDFPDARKSQAALAQSILQRLIDFPELRDEAYCYLIKQTTRHPKEYFSSTCSYVNYHIPNSNT